MTGELDGDCRIVVLSGAGMSAESGIRTFRDNGGLWEEYDVMTVATPEAWKQNPALVTRFYNQRRTQLKEVEPNPGHRALAELEAHFQVHVITQNVDDLHERAGSTQVMHLHGRLTQMRSEKYPYPVYDVGYTEMELDACGADGGRLRPNIVWFGEEVPLIADASHWVMQADVLIVVGTSLNVYPAAGLLYHARHGCEKYLVDPGEHQTQGVFRLKHLKQKAGDALPNLVRDLIQRKGN